MTINEVVEKIHNDNIARGWWEGVSLPLKASDIMDVYIVVAKLSLVTSENSEALEEVRDGRAFDHVYYDAGKPCGFPIEVADAVIRLFDLSAACGFNLERAIDEKLAYNRTRGHKHGGKVL